MPTRVFKSRGDLPQVLVEHSQADLEIHSDATNCILGFCIYYKLYWFCMGGGKKGFTCTCKPRMNEIHPWITSLPVADGWPWNAPLKWKTNKTQTMKKEKEKNEISFQSYQNEADLHEERKPRKDLYLHHLPTIGTLANTPHSLGEHQELPSPLDPSLYLQPELQSVFGILLWVLSHLWQMLPWTPTTSALHRSWSYLKNFKRFRPCSNSHMSTQQSKFILALNRFTRWEWV